MLNDEVAAHERPTYAALLDAALTEPGELSAAYHAFHDYSFGNVIAAWSQCHAQGLELGPMATLKSWNARGRRVIAGSKALWLCQPRTGTRRDTAHADSSDPRDADATFTYFTWRKGWFVLAQTQGEPFEVEALAADDWSVHAALVKLNVATVPFDIPDGNCQGFARKRTVSVSPLALYPLKTAVHEIAHVHLGHTTGEAGDYLADAGVIPSDHSERELEAEGTAYLVTATLGLPGLAESRGYMQHWATDRESITETMARRIFSCANVILAAGRTATLTTT